MKSHSYSSSLGWYGGPVTELELLELREVPKVSGLGCGPVGGGQGGASNAVRRSVLASTILGVSAINSLILSQLPWKPRGYSNPFVSTHQNQSRAIRLHSLASGHSSSYDLISCCANSFLSKRVEGSATSSVGSSSMSRTIWRAESRLVRASLPSSSSTSSPTARNSTNPR